MAQTEVQLTTQKSTSGQISKTFNRYYKVIIEGNLVEVILTLPTGGIHRFSIYEKLIYWDLADYVSFEFLSKNAIVKYYGSPSPLNNVVYLKP